jgi:hypothetical protein
VASTLFVILKELSSQKFHCIFRAYSHSLLHNVKVSDISVAPASPNPVCCVRIIDCIKITSMIEYFHWHMYIASFMEVGQPVQNLEWDGTHTHTHTQVWGEGVKDGIAGLETNIVEVEVPSWKWCQSGWEW